MTTKTGTHKTKRSISLGWLGPVVFAAMLSLPILMAAVPGQASPAATEPAPARRLSRLARCEEPAAKPEAEPPTGTCQLTASPLVLASR